MLALHTHKCESVSHIICTRCDLFGLAANDWTDCAIGEYVPPDVPVGVYLLQSRWESIFSAFIKLIDQITGALNDRIVPNNFTSQQTVANKYISVAQREKHLNRKITIFIRMVFQFDCLIDTLFSFRMRLNINTYIYIYSHRARVLLAHLAALSQSSPQLSRRVLTTEKCAISGEPHRQFKRWKLIFFSTTTRWKKTLSCNKRWKIRGLSDWLYSRSTQNALFL